MGVGRLTASRTPCEYTQRASAPRSAAGCELQGNLDQGFECAQSVVQHLLADRREREVADVLGEIEEGAFGGGVADAVRADRDVLRREVPGAVDHHTAPDGLGQPVGRRMDRSTAALAKSKQCASGVAREHQRCVRSADGGAPCPKVERCRREAVDAFERGLEHTDQEQVTSLLVRNAEVLEVAGADDAVVVVEPAGQMSVECGHETPRRWRRTDRGKTIRNLSPRCRVHTRSNVGVQT
ncbi:unannotated protein [freshwater metagenome]|uniref:Unannotated protein n=1 Tax=freshwater metagenome TaxID=449393 RepID=A0A6J7AKA7_9ZZZZ